MKAFFDEYGLVIVICLVVIVLVALAAILGAEGGVFNEALDSIIESWANKAKTLI